MLGDPRRTSTYAASGVDRGAVAESLARLLAAARYRPPPGHGRVLGPAGHFAALVRIGRETIAITTDTVGTKTLLAEAMDRWEEVGEDLVAVNVNDLAAVGARPSALVDCLSVPSTVPERFAAIGRGLRRGLEAAGIGLVGGETAVVPSIVQGYDLGGTAVGYFPRGRRPVTGAAIRPGDRLVGIPSSGLHANGLTLVRRLLAEGRIDLQRPRPGGDGPIGVELLTPTRSYPKLTEAVAGLRGVHGFAHISGGGVRNLVRLKGSVAFSLDEWPERPSLFRWIGELGEIADREMFQTFNMGIGFVVVVEPSAEATVLRRLARAGAPDARRIGTVGRGRGVELPGLGLTYSDY